MTSPRPLTNNSPQQALLASPAGVAGGLSSFGDLHVSESQAAALAQKLAKQGRGQYSEDSLRQTLEGAPISAVRSNLRHDVCGSGWQHNGPGSDSQQPGRSTLVSPSQPKSSRRMSTGRTDPLHPQASRVSAGEQQQRQLGAVDDMHNVNGRISSAPAAHKPEVAHIDEPGTAGGQAVAALQWVLQEGALTPGDCVRSAQEEQQLGSEQQAPPQQGGALCAAQTTSNDFPATQLVLLPSALLLAAAVQPSLPATAAFLQPTLPVTGAAMQLALPATQAVCVSGEHEGEGAADGVTGCAAALTRQEDLAALAAALGAAAMAAALAACEAAGGSVCDAAVAAAAPEGCGAPGAAVQEAREHGQAEAPPVAGLLAACPATATAQLAELNGAVEGGAAAAPAAAEHCKADAFIAGQQAAAVGFRAEQEFVVTAAGSAKQLPLTAELPPTEEAAGHGPLAACTEPAAEVAVHDADRGMAESEALQVNSPRSPSTQQLALDGKPPLATKQAEMAVAPLVPAMAVAAGAAGAGTGSSVSASDGRSFLDEYSSGSECSEGEGVPPSPLCTAEELAAARQQEQAVLLAQSPSVVGLSLAEAEAGVEAGVSQFQSLHGLEAETQLEIDQQHRQFSEGDAAAAVRVFAVGDTISCTLEAVLPTGAAGSVSLQTKSNLQRAIWRSFRCQSLDASLTLEGAALQGGRQAGGGAAAGLQTVSALAADEGLLPKLGADEESRLSRYLCNASEVRERLQQLEESGALQALAPRRRTKAQRAQRSHRQRSSRRGSGRPGQDGEEVGAAGETPVPRSTARQRQQRPMTLTVTPGDVGVLSGAALNVNTSEHAGLQATEAAHCGAVATQLAGAQVQGPAALELDATQPVGAAMAATAPVAAVAAMLVGAAADGPSQLEVSITQGGTGTMAAAAAMVALPGAPQAQQSPARGGMCDVPHVPASVVAAAAVEGAPAAPAAAADGASQLDVELSLQVPPQRSTAGTAEVAPPQAPPQPPAPVTTTAAGGVAPQQHEAFDLLLASQGSQQPQQQAGVAPGADDIQSPAGKDLQFRGNWLRGGWVGRREQQLRQQGLSDQEKQRQEVQQAQAAQAQVQAPSPAGPTCPAPAGLEVMEDTPSGMHPPASPPAVLAQDQPQQQEVASGAAAQGARASSSGGRHEVKDAGGVPETPPEGNPDPVSPELGSAPALAGVPAQQPGHGHREEGQHLGVSDEAQQQQPSAAAAEEAQAAAAAADSCIEVPDTEEGEEAVQLAERQAEEQPAPGFAILPATVEVQLGSSQERAGGGAGSSGGVAIAMPPRQRSKQLEHREPAAAAPVPAGAVTGQGSAAGQAPVVGEPGAQVAARDAAAAGDGAADEQDAPLGSQAVQNAMQMVGLLSSHLAATQEQLPPLAEPVGLEGAAAGDEGNGPEPGVVAAQAQPAPLDLATAVVAAGAAAAEVTGGAAGLDGAPPVSPRGRRRWRQRLGVSDSEEEEERDGMAAAAAAAQRRQRSVAAPPAEESPEVALLGKRVSRREQAKKRRSSHLAAVMAPAGARPDLGLSHNERRLLVPQPAAAARDAAAGGVGPGSPGQQRRQRSSSRSPAASPRRITAAVGTKSPRRQPVRSSLAALRMSPPRAAAAPRSPAKKGGEAALPAAAGRPASDAETTAAAPAATAAVATGSGGGRASGRGPHMPKGSLHSRIAAVAATDAAPKKNSGLIDDAPCFVDSQMADAAAAGARAATAAVARAATAATDAAAMPPPPARRVQAAKPAQAAEPTMGKAAQLQLCKPVGPVIVPTVASAAAAGVAHNQQGAAEAEGAAAQMAAAALQQRQPQHPAAALAQQAAAASSRGNASDPYRFPNGSSGGNPAADVGQLPVSGPRVEGAGGGGDAGSSPSKRRRLSGGCIGQPGTGQGQKPLNPTRLAKVGPSKEAAANTAVVAPAATVIKVAEVQARMAAEEEHAPGRVGHNGRKRRRRRGEGEEEEEEERKAGQGGRAAAAVEDGAAGGCAAEPGLLVTLLPHPVVQTAPDAAGCDASEAAVLAVETSARPARCLKKPARFAGSPAKPAVMQAPAAGASNQQQQQHGEGHAGGSGRPGGRKRVAAASPAPAPCKAAGARVTRQQREAKRQRTTPGPAAAAAAGDITPPAVAPLPDSEDQTLAEYVRTHPRWPGCSKCRYSRSGCGKCRADAAVAAVEVLTPIAGRAATREQRQQQPPSAAAARGTKSPPAVAAPVAPQSHHQQRKAQEQHQKAEEQGQDGEDEEDGAGAPTQSLVSSGQPSPSAGARRKSGIRAGSGRCFEGCVFLVTGFNDTPTDKARLLAALREGGATVLDAVPHPVTQAPSTGRRQSAGARQLSLHPAVTAVVSDRRTRTPKYIYAAIQHLPVVKPEWVLTCAKVRKQLPMKDAILFHKPAALQPGSTASPGVFAGLRICAFFPRHLDSMAKSMTLLLRHAGATLHPRLEEEVDEGVGVCQPCCDLVLLDEEDWMEEAAGPGGKRAADDMLRLARRLRLPVHKREWAIEAMLNGKLPNGFGGAATTPVQPKLQPAPRDPHSDSVATTSTGPKPATAGVLATHLQANGGGRGQHAAGAAPAAAATVVIGTSPRGKKRTRAVVEQQPPQQQQQQQQQDSGGKNAAQDSWQQQVSPVVRAGLRWVGKPQDPPPPMRPTTHRQYYPAFIKDGDQIELGGFAEALLSGEQEPRVVQVMALWGEKPGQMFARFRRFYRPQETPIPALGGPHHLFRSDHVDDRVPLTTVLRKCSVTLPGGLEAPARPAAGQSSYMCVAQLDHEVMLVGALPPDCDIPGGAGTAIADLAR